MAAAALAGGVGVSLTSTAMPLQRTLVMSVVIATLAVVGLVAPAQAGDLTAGCTVGYRRLTAWAYYWPDGAHHSWLYFEYELSGPEIGHQSNVNLWVKQDGITMWSYYSPDSLGPGVRHGTAPPSVLYTSMQAAEWTEFQAIFDVFWASDPKCPARTQTI
jgi:hypothetical protein